MSEAWRTQKGTRKFLQNFTWDIVMTETTREIWFRENDNINIDRKMRAG